MADTKISIPISNVSLSAQKNQPVKCLIEQNEVKQSFWLEALE